ncbi:hypothetical protein A2246_01220 [candidate division WOR-1 bacterium RIFOXYA2_FULL_37_7]|nr:MAG: hypothetical protein A2246_01220 [candidate division WOR-1 bacterium RIFOXYA2_FULL_37_7]
MSFFILFVIIPKEKQLFKRILQKKSHSCICVDFFIQCIDQRALIAESNTLKGILLVKPYSCS